MSKSHLSRRELLQRGGIVAVAGTAGRAMAADVPASRPARTAFAPPFKLGLVTYNLAKEWDLPTLLKTCKATGFECVELRTTHKHGVEPTIDAARRREVRRQFADAGLRLWGLGTVCEFHSPDAAVVERNIETCKQFCELARDVGAAGVKVRPNGLPDGVPVEKTLAQIGGALRKCAAAADANGVEIWVEVHGGGTSHPPHMRTIMDHCDHPKVGLTWNSNPTDVKDGSVREYFERLRPKILSCHITELTSAYPYRELFSLLTTSGYSRVTLCEAQGLHSRDRSDVERFMRYYRALWLELCRPR